MKRKKLLAASIAAALAPMTAQAVDFSISGHVNRMIRYADDGHDSDVQHLDNSGLSGSRWRMEGAGELDGGLMAGATIESAFLQNGGTPLVDAEGMKTSGKGEADTSVRHSYIWLSGNFGKLSLGHTAPAGTGAMWTTYSGAWMGTAYDSPAVASGVLLRTSNGATDNSLVANFGSVSLSRTSVLRYDTPSIGPVSASASIDGDDNWAVGGSVSTDMGGSSFQAGLLFAEAQGNDETKFGIGGGVAFANGSSVNLAYGADDSKSDDHRDIYVGLAHTWGNSSAAIGYRTVKDAHDQRDAKAIGLGFNQSLGGGVDVYAGYNHMSVEEDGGPEYEDVDVFHIGSRVRFN